jgi:hypothetical protein
VSVISERHKSQSSAFSTEKLPFPVPSYSVLPPSFSDNPVSHIFLKEAMVCVNNGSRGSVFSFMLLAILGTLNESFKMPAKGMRIQGSQRNAAITIPAKDPKFDFGPLGKLAFSLLPLSPESVGRRKTIFTEVVAGKVWTLDQVGIDCNIDDDLV